MKCFLLALMLVMVFSNEALLSQQTAPLSRFTIGLETGTGNADDGCCSDTWGFFVLAGTAEYRMARFFSWEASLRYLGFEGALQPYSTGPYGFSLSGFNRGDNVMLTAGPRFNLVFRRGLELSLALKGGARLNMVSQEILNYGNFLQTRRYKPDLRMIYEGNLRFSWWLTDAMAVECLAGLMTNMRDRKRLNLKSVEGMEIPDANSEPAQRFVSEISGANGYFNAIQLAFGVRFRLR